MHIACENGNSALLCWKEKSVYHHIGALLTIQERAFCVCTVLVRSISWMVTATVCSLTVGQFLEAQRMFTLFNRPTSHFRSHQKSWHQTSPFLLVFLGRGPPHSPKSALAGSESSGSGAIAGACSSRPILILNTSRQNPPWLDISSTNSLLSNNSSTC